MLHLITQRRLSAPACRVRDADRCHLPTAPAGQAGAQAGRERSASRLSMADRRDHPVLVGRDHLKPARAAASQNLTPLCGLCVSAREMFG